MKWHNLIPFLKALWHRPAGPMNWKNPIRVMAVVGWLVFQGLMLLGWAVFRAGRFVAGLPAPAIFFFAGLWYAVWSFVRRPFPAFDENPLLDLMKNRNRRQPEQGGSVFKKLLLPAVEHRRLQRQFVAEC